MRKKDLKALYVVELKNNEKGLLVNMGRSNYKGLHLWSPGNNGTQQTETFINDDLTSKFSEFDIVKVWGYSCEPTQLVSVNTDNRELLWEREEPLYTLKLPNNNNKNKYYRHHFNGNYSFNKGLINDANVKCMFTQAEIDNLPNQELIKALVKKEVKGN